MTTQSTRQIMLTAGVTASMVKGDVSYILGVVVALIIFVLIDKVFDWIDAKLGLSPIKSESEAL